MATMSRRGPSRRNSGLGLTDVKDWNCCGAMEVKNIDPKIQTYLSARVLSQAVNVNKQDVVMAPCNGCYHNLKKAEYDLAHDAESIEVVDKLSAKAGHETYKAGQAETIHALDWIKHTIGEEGLKQAHARASSPGSKSPTTTAACTCARATSSRRRTKARAARARRSRISWMICSAAAGAENVEFPLKTACCGGAHTLSDSDTSTKLVLNILQAAEASGAEVIATECPTCHSGLEMHQIRAEKRFGKKTSVKILYFTQLLGLALGIGPRKLGIHTNISDSIDFLVDKRVI